MAHHGDAFGEALLEYLDGGEGAHVLERDDGLVEGFPTVEPYFGGPDGYAPIERQALNLIGEKVLDIGAGAVRFSLAVQEGGADVVALDDSAGAIEVCRRRGVERLVNESSLPTGGPFRHVLDDGPQPRSARPGSGSIARTSCRHGDAGCGGDRHHPRPVRDR